MWRNDKIMNKSAKYYELQALDLWDFPALIKKAREIQGITLEGLCKDICSSSLMGRIEKENDMPIKNFATGFWQGWACALTVMKTFFSMMIIWCGNKSKGL